jgi:hypothetical protein
MVIKNAFAGFLNVIEKMIQNNSFKIGTVGAIITSIAEAFISKLFNTHGVTILHAIFFGMVSGICIIDWLIGDRLSKKKLIYESNIAIDALIRFVIFLIILAIMLGLDWIFGTGAFLYSLIAIALVYHNTQSVVANIYVLRWEKYFPIWLFKWAESEIKAKLKKYMGEK